jgi:glycosyltransferase involved in cell wall biosynthesis
MKVLIDARKLNDGGIGTYIKTLLQALLLDESIRISVILSHKNDLENISLQGKNKLTILERKNKKYSLSEYILMPRSIDWRAYDLYHSPHYTLPFSVPIPTVVTIHDAIHIFHPEKWYYPYISYPLFALALKNASRIIAVSQSTKRELLSLKIPKLYLNKSQYLTKIDVVQNAREVDRRYTDSDNFEKLMSDNIQSRDYILKNTSLSLEKDHENFISALREKKPFFALYSNLKPHKGFGDLLLTYCMLKKLFPEEFENFPLIIAGKGTETVTLYQDSKDILQDSIFRLGKISDDLLFYLYKKAYVLVIPSYTEGFCLPALEAKLFGLPVICRPVPAICEILNDSEQNQNRTDLQRKNIIAQDYSIHSLADVLLEALRQQDTLYKKEDSSLYRKKFSLYRFLNEVKSVYTKTLEGS